MNIDENIFRMHIYLILKQTLSTRPAQLVRNARLTVEHNGKVETDAHFEDSYYDSPKPLAKKLNGDKPGRVKFSYEPVTQKFVANVKSETTFTLYGDLPDILGFGVGTGDRPVPFERGKVTVTLHFRRCSSGLFR